MAEEKVLGIRIEIKGSKEQNTELGKLQLNINKIKEAQRSLTKAVKEGNISRTKAAKSQAALNTQLKAAKNAYRDTESAILKQNNALRKNSGFVSGIKKGVGQLATSFLGVTAAIGLVVGAFRDAARTIVAFDESVANLAKTTNLSVDAARDLAAEVIKIDTTSSVTELLELASAAGRLGLEGQDIIDFTREADKAFVALGDSLTGSAEEIALTLGKLASSFNLEEEFGIGDAINRIGSVINELGATTKASEGPIIDFTKRLAGVASQAGISLPDIAALGALFDANGQSMEVAATTMQKLLPEMGKNVSKFAKTAGMNIEDFSALLRDKPFEALKAVARGANSSEEGLLGLTDTLKKYGINSARAAGIVTLLSEKTDELNGFQLTANEALKEGTSLTKEFNIKQQTLGASVKKAGNAWDKFVLSMENGDGPIGKVIKGFIDINTEYLGMITSFISGESVWESVVNSALGVAETLGLITAEEEKQSKSLLKNRLLLEVLHKEYEAGKITLEQYNKLEKDVLNGTVKTTKAKTKETEAIKENSEAIEEEIILSDEEIKAREKAAEKAFNDRKKRDREAFKEAEKLGQEGKNAAIKRENDIAKAEEVIRANKIAAIKFDNDREIALLESKFDKQISLITGNSQREIELRLQLGLQKKEALDEQQQTFREEAVAQEEQDESDKLQRQTDTINKVADVTKQVLSIINTNREANQNLELNDVEKRKIAALESLDAQLSAENITKEEREDLLNQRAVAENKFKEEEDVINRKFAEKERKIKIAEIGINLAAELSALALAAAKGPASIATGGIGAAVTYALTAGIAIATAAVNVKKINSETFADGGMLNGASHAGGGIPFTVNGRPGFEAEGGEAIINKNSMADPYLRGIASWVNQQGGGKAFAKGGRVPTRFQDGGDVPSVQAAVGLSTEGLAELIAESVGTMKVINVATDTADVANEVINIESDASFG